MKIKKISITSRILPVNFRIQKGKKELLNTLGVDNEGASFESTWNKFAGKVQSGKEKMAKDFSLTTRYYAVFGLTGLTLLMRRNLKSPVITFGLASFFVCPEIITGIWKS